MDAYEIPTLLRARRETSAAYLEFLRVPSMSAGVYELSKAGEDTQSPHGEDEIYYVLDGRATLRVGGEDREVSPGTLIYVPARVEHAFHTIRARLSLLVVFSPAEGTSASRKDGEESRRTRVGKR